MSINNIERFLKSKNIAFQVHLYQYEASDLSVDTLAAMNGWDVTDIFKTLMLTDNSDRLIIAVLSGNQTLDRKRLARHLNIKKVLFLSVSDLPAKTGFQRGGCSPIVLRRSAVVVIDSSVYSKQKIFVNAGERGKLLLMDAQDLIKLCRADVVSISDDQSE